MSKLTKRERILIYILLVVLVAVGGAFLIRGAALESADVSQKLTDAELQLMQVQAAAQAAMGGESESPEQLNEQVLALQKKFLPVMTNDDLDRYITGILQDNGLVAESLEIAVSEAPAKQAEDAAEGEETPAASGAQFRTYSVKTTSRGALEQYIALIDAVSGMTGTRISMLNLRIGTETSHVRTLTAEEYAVAKALVDVRNDEGRSDRRYKTEADPLPYVSVPYMEYAADIQFEVIEYDRSHYDALIASVG